MIQRKVTPSCFFARPSKTDKVARYDVETELWFVYPLRDGNILYDDNEAVLYAGVHEFFAWDDLKTIHEDLKVKMNVLYGEPYYTGNELCNLFGEPAFSEGALETYHSDTEKYEIV